MIDGIKIGVVPLGAEDSDILEFAPYGNRQIAKYKGLIIYRYGTGDNLSGSIHKYFNNGQHNANDFKLSHFIDSVDDLSRTLNMNVEVSSLTQVEFGVNVAVDFDIDNFISSIICLGNKAPIANSLGIEFRYTDYTVKIYKKIAPNGDKLLRYEIQAKTKKLRDIIEQNDTYIARLGDLVSSNVWRAFGKELLKVYDTILFADARSIDANYLKGEDITLFISGCRSHYWSKRWNDGKSKSRQLTRFKTLIKENSTSTSLSDARKLIETKIKELIDIEVSPISTPYFGLEILEDKMPRITKWWSSQQVLENATDSQTVETLEKVEMPQIPNLDELGICGISENKKRFCKVTGLSLNIGIKQNDVLSTKGVEYYYQNEREIFDKILLPRLSEKWIEKGIKKQCEEIAHSLRNERHNTRNNSKRDIRKIASRGINFLFTPGEVLDKYYLDVYESLETS